MKRIIPYIVIAYLLINIIVLDRGMSDLTVEVNDLHQQIADYADHTDNVDRILCGYDDVIAEIKDRQQEIVENQSSLIDLYAEMAEYTKDRYVMFNDWDWDTASAEKGE